MRLAINLARSFRVWHHDSKIDFALATDQVDGIPPDLAEMTVIRVAEGQYGEGFSPKLFLDRLAPAQQTLFVDADCLCVGNLECVFEEFNGRAVSVVGGRIAAGEWFGNVAAICRRFSVGALPKFNGGIYYLETGVRASAVYAKARTLEQEYDALGLIRLRGRPNDELLMAISMAMHGLSAIPDDGSILSSPLEAPEKLRIDVFRGESSLVNPEPPDPLHQAWYPLRHVKPLIVHFLGDHHQRFEYAAEAFKLRYWNKPRLVRRIMQVVATLLITVPGRLRVLLKDALRPVYRRVVGVRALKQSERV